MMPQNPTPLDGYVSVIFDHATDQANNHHHHHPHHGILLQTQPQDAQTLYLVPSVTPTHTQLTHHQQPQQQASQVSIHLQPSTPQHTARQQQQQPLLQQSQQQQQPQHIQGSIVESTPLQSHHLPRQQMQPQSLVNVATGNLVDSSHTAIAVAPQGTATLVENELKNQLLVLTDLPGTSTILQVPSAGSSAAAVIQVQPALQVSQQINLIEVPSPTINLVQIPNAAAPAVAATGTPIGASAIASSVELVQVPNTVYLTNTDQPLILCLPHEMTLQPSTSYIVEDSLLEVNTPQSHPQAISVATTASVNTVASDVNMNQIAMAKSWHSDSDLVNRAMTALGRHNLSNDSPSVLPIQHLHLNCTSGATH